ncbi:MAG: tetratricopeptide repeat protein, partial [Candidatus Geothermincolia bacterium]
NLDSDAREAIKLSDAMLAYAELKANKVIEVERTYERITRFGSAGLYVPTLYGCETFYNVYDLWAQILNRLGNYKKNVRVVPGAFLFNPNFVSLPYAHALSQTGDDVGALNALTDYLTVHPGSAVAYAERGEIQLVRGEFKAAAESLRTAVELDATDAKAHYDLAVALVQLNDRKGAIAELNAAIEKGQGTVWADRAKSILDSLNKGKQ